MAEPVVLKVRMSCAGCSGAVKRVLSKMEGVESFDIDMEQQKVTVRGTATPQAVLQTVCKTGKRAEFWNADAESKEVASPAAVSTAAPPAEITPIPSC